MMTTVFVHLVKKQVCALNRGVYISIWLHFDPRYEAISTMKNEAYQFRVKENIQAAK